jgi:hypothetical protein
MDEQKLHNFKLPVEWIDRIFIRLAEAYGSKFASQFMKPSYVDLEKLRWQSGLYGTTPEEIKSVLDMCKSGYIPNPPNVIEFFHYCKGHKQPIVKKEVASTSKAKPEVAEKYMKLIMDKLHGRLDSEGEAALSALDKQVLSKPDVKNPHWQDN